MTLAVLVGCTKGRAIHPQPPKPTVELKAYPAISIKPDSVTFYIKISEHSEALDCAAIEWNFDDGCKELQQDFTCNGHPLRWTKQHYYRSYGSFRPAIYFRSQVDGSIIEWAEARLDIVYQESKGSPDAGR